MCQQNFPATVMLAWQGKDKNKDYTVKIQSLLLCSAWIPAARFGPDMLLGMLVLAIRPSAELSMASHSLSQTLTSP